MLNRTSYFISFLNYFHKTGEKKSDTKMLSSFMSNLILVWYLLIVTNIILSSIDAW